MTNMCGIFMSLIGCSYFFIISSCLESKKINAIKKMQIEYKKGFQNIKFIECLGNINI